MKVAEASFTTIAVVFIGMACSVEDGGSPARFGGNGGSGGEDPGAGGIGGAELIECLRDYRVPSLEYRGCSFRPDEGVRPITWYYSASCLPESANSGDKHCQYWLDGSEVPCFRLFFGLGDGFPHELGRATVTMLVDGRQVPFSVDGGSPTLLQTIDLDPQGVHDIAWEICLDEATPGIGLHLLSPVVTFPTPGLPNVQPRRLVAVRDTTCLLDPLPAVSPTEIIHGEGLSSWVEDAETGHHLFGMGDWFRKVEDGRLPIRLHLYRSSLGFDGDSDAIIVALVDEQEFPLGDLGFAPRVKLPDSPNDAAIYDVVLEGLPLGTQRHRLTFLQLSGYGMLDQDSDGNVQEFPPFDYWITSFDYGYPE